MPLEFPQMVSRERVDKLWEDVWRIVEQLRLMDERIRTLEKAADKNATADGTVRPWNG